MIPLIMVIVLSSITLFYLLSSIASEAIKRHNKKWTDQLETRNFGILSKWDYLKNPLLAKKLRLFIEKTASEDADSGVYLNRFEDKKHFDLYKKCYQTCRKEVIVKKAEEDSLKNEWSTFLDSTEQNIYQESYLMYKAKESERGTAWSDSLEENKQHTVEAEDFKKHFSNLKITEGEQDD